jgi:hypothetical protein
MPNSLIDSLLALATASPMPSEVRRILMDDIRRSTLTVTGNPRQDTEGNFGLLHVICALLFNEVETLYGDGAYIKLHLHPSFQDAPSSQVVPLESDSETFGLVIGTHAVSWEDVFYEIAHEMVHMLNPVSLRRNNELATLEEGVAVKFAESAYAKWITSYTKRHPRWSPVVHSDERYAPAFHATNKIADALLKQVRAEFGSFWAVKDLVRFQAMTAGRISSLEASLLVAPFRYPPIGGKLV